MKKLLVFLSAVVIGASVTQAAAVSWKVNVQGYEGKTVYMEQCVRFLKIRTEDKKLELNLSNRYKPEIEMLSELLGLHDYAPVKQEIKENKKMRRKLRRNKKKEALELE